VSVADGGKGDVDVVADGETYTADYVLVTLPLAVLRQNTITFTPPLPTSKLQAIQKLGVGVMEKVLFFIQNLLHRNSGLDNYHLGCRQKLMQIQHYISEFNLLM